MRNFAIFLIGICCMLSIVSCDDSHQTSNSQGSGLDQGNRRIGNGEAVKYECKVPARVLELSIDDTDNELLLSIAGEKRFFNVYSYTSSTTEPASIDGKWKFEAYLLITQNKILRMSPRAWEEHPDNQGFRRLNEYEPTGVEVDISEGKITFEYLASDVLDDQLLPCSVTVNAEFEKLADDSYRVKAGSGKRQY